MTTEYLQPFDYGHVLLPSVDSAYSEFQKAALRYSAVSKFKVFMLDQDGTLHGPVTPGLVATFSAFEFREVGILHAGFVTLTLGDSENRPLQQRLDRNPRVPKLRCENGDVRYFLDHRDALGNFEEMVSGVGRVKSVSGTWSSKELLLLPPTRDEGEWIRTPSVFVGSLPNELLLQILQAMDE